MLVASRAKATSRKADLLSRDRQSCSGKPPKIHERRLTATFRTGSSDSGQKGAMSKAGDEANPASGQKDKGVVIMLKKIIISTAVAASALTALPAAAEAQSRYGYSNRYDNQGYGRGSYDQGQRYANQRYYGQRGSIRATTIGAIIERTYNGGYYNHRRQRCSGSTGTIIGAIAGGLLGSQVAGRATGRSAPSSVPVPGPRRPGDRPQRLPLAAEQSLARRGEVGPAPPMKGRRPRHIQSGSPHLRIRFCWTRCRRV